MNLSESAVNKPTTTLLTFLVLVSLGIFCIFNLPVDMYPDMELPYMIVYTSYENAGPEEVEQSISRILESSLSGLGGLKKIQSQSMAGLSLIFLEMNYGTNLDSAANEIRDKIDLVRGYLPSSAKSPITIKLDPSMMPIMMLSLRGERTPEELRTLAKDIIQPKFEQIDGVASANIVGGREKSINVDIPKDRLEAYRLVISSIAQMIGSQNIQTSGGKITTADTNYTIKTDGKYKNLEDLKNTVISYKNGASGKVSVLLRDIADVYQGYKEESTLAYLDGEACVILTIQKQSGKNSVTAARKVRKVLKELQSELPGDVSLIETQNTTDIIEQTISEVVNSVIQGALLAIAVLFIFLRSFRSTIIIGIAIPVSVLITIFLMYFTGISINMISMAGLLLGIGMLVDNSIVVLENIYAYRQRDAKPKVAAVLGAKEMVMSISASTFTSVCIFLPMLMFKKKLGIMGQIFNDLALTIIYSLICSLVVAVVLVPMLSSSYLKIGTLNNPDSSKLWSSINNAFNKFFIKIDNLYAVGVKFVLYHKKLCVFALLGVFIISIASIKLIGFIFMPESASDSVAVEFELPKGTTIEVTNDTMNSFLAMISPELKGIKFTAVMAGGTSIIPGGSETHKGKVTFTLYPINERQPNWENETELKDKIRKYFTAFPGATLKFSQNMNNATSGGLIINIKSDDLTLVRQTASQIERLLREKASDYVTEVSCDLEDGLPQVEIIVDRNKMYELGLNIFNVGAEITAAINGTVASRYTDSGGDIDILVQMSNKDKKKLSDLDTISVLSPIGRRIPLSSFARYEENTSPVTIYRENQARIAHVTAKPIAKMSLDKVQTEIRKLIDDNIPREEKVSISFSGDYQDMMEAVANFGLIIFMAAVLVFVVMASQFESLVDPFIVILTIPLSFIGVIAIYAIVGERLSVITVMGVLVLVGTIVNNGIVLVDYTNLLRKRGYGLEEACIEAAKNRLRPILMTTLTTVISLAPMAFFPGEGSASMQPISLTVFGGMSFGSLMTLFLMPAVYHIINSRRMKKAQTKQAKTVKKISDNEKSLQDKNDS